MGSLWQDLRLGIRGLLKSPGFTVVTVLTLALGIGANTAIFTVLNAVLLRALPADEPQRLVMLSNPEYHGIGVGDGSGKRGMYAYSEFRDLLEKNQVFSGMLAVDSYVRRTDVSMEGARSPEPEHANVTMVSGDYFHVLGIRPYLGRTFTAEVDKVQHANPVAVNTAGAGDGATPGVRHAPRAGSGKFADRSADADGGLAAGTAGWSGQPAAGALGAGGHRELRSERHPAAGEREKLWNLASCRDVLLERVQQIPKGFQKAIH